MMNPPNGNVGPNPNDPELQRMLQQGAIIQPRTTKWMCIVCENEAPLIQGPMIPPNTPNHAFITKMSSDPEGAPPMVHCAVCWARFIRKNVPALVEVPIAWKPGDALPSWPGDAPQGRE